MKIYCSFSGVYADRRLKEDERIVPLEDIEGTNGYCSLEAAKEIERRLDGFEPVGIHFIDNGNYHYASAFWIRKIEEPFSLIVFDRHTDMQSSSLIPALSCGNWIAELQKDCSLPLKKTLIIGPPKIDIELAAEACSDNTLFISMEEANIEKPQVCKAIEKIISKDYPIYISIDKDVLSETEIKVNWEQGEMNIETLETALRYICENYDVIGIDVCGEAEPHSFVSSSCKKSELRLYDIISSLNTRK